MGPLGTYALQRPGVKPSGVTNSYGTCALGFTGVSGLLARAASCAVVGTTAGQGLE